MNRKIYVRQRIVDTWLQVGSKQLTAKKLGYTINKKSGSSSFINKVIDEFLKKSNSAE